MAEALDTHALNMAISDMIDNAKTRLFIISPYLNIYHNLRKAIELADKRGVNTVVIYRKVDDNSDVIQWLASLNHIFIGHSNNLHAKYYGEDSAAIITSMNLYEYSQVNNEELGIFIRSKEDIEAFYDMVYFVQRILEHCETIYATIKCVFVEEKKIISKIPNYRFSMLEEPINNIVIEEMDPEPPLETEENTLRGFCIRCGKKIDLDSETYYCDACYTRWKQYNNPNYQEKYCHICGKPEQTSAYKPVCKDCFPGSSDVINRKKDIVLKNVKYGR